MSYRKNNLIFSFFVFFLIGLFSIASFSALNFKGKNKSKGKKQGSFTVKLNGKAIKKASGKAKISYNAPKRKADMKLDVKRLPTIFPASNYTDPHFYEGWFFMEDEYVVSTGAFNTDNRDKGKSYVRFNPNDMDEAGHNLSALRRIKVTKESNDGDIYPTTKVVLDGKVTFKNSPYKNIYGGKLK